MNLVFDDLCFCFGMNGISKYWENILESWKTIAHKSDVKISILNRSNHFENSGFDLIPFPSTWWGDKHLALDREILQRVLNSLSADVYIPSYSRFALETPTLQIIYDLLPEHNKIGEFDRDWLERKLAILCSDAAIATNETTQKEFKKYYPNSQILSEKLAYPSSNNEEFFRRSSVEVEDFRNRYLISGKYLLIPAINEAIYGSNLIELVFKSIQLGKFPDLEIVVMGGGQIPSNFLEIARKARVKITLLKLSEKELAIAYSGAEITVFSSLHGDLGIPIIESISCGTPVITSSSCSLPEKISKYVHRFDSDNFDQFNSLLHNLIKINSPNNQLLLVQELDNRISWVESAKTILTEATLCAQNGINRSHEIQKIIGEYSNLARAYQS